MHKSTFHYNVTRPYPYRWFTPVAVIGGIVFAVLFSLLNVGVSGYYLATKYTSDPNTTEAGANAVWYLKSPFNWGDRPRPKCEAQSLPVGYEFFTTNFGLKYTIAGVSQISANTDVQQVLSSVSYLNNTLQDCAVDTVTFDLKKVDNSKPPSWWWSWDESSSKVTSYCTVSNPDGSLKLALSTTLANPNSFDWIISNNYTTHASLWWGSRLLSTRYFGVQQTMAQVGTNSSSTASPFVKGSMNWHSKGSDPRSYDYFSMDYYFIDDGGSAYNVEYPPEWLYNNATWGFSPPMTEGLQFAKTFRSLVEVDLGATTAGNLFLEDQSLQYAIFAPDDFNRQAGGELNSTSGLDWNNWNGINYPGTPLNASNTTAVNETYPSFKSVMGPLGTRPATIYGQYACSVPVQKSPGALFLAVLLADLVFLQALWKAYNLVVGWMVDQNDERAQWCSGCLGDDPYTGVGLKDVRKANGYQNGIGDSDDFDR